MGMRSRFLVYDILTGFVLAALSCSYVLLRRFPVLILPALMTFLAVNLFSGTRRAGRKDRRLRICSHGGALLVGFAVSTLAAAVYHIGLAFYAFPADPMLFVWSGVLCVCLEAAVFWNGILCVYLTSWQLGIKLRVIGILCGMIPVANLIALGKILRVVSEEVCFESEKERINALRADEQICRTKYPLLMVHGVFFRDSVYFNYWGRIPAELEANGARVYYGAHQSAASVADSAQELTQRIRAIVAETGCEKVNIIAHSKGGLDCRYAIARLGAAPMVASLTTVNTPHRGCKFADSLLSVIPERVKDQVAATYNKTLRKFGDPNPDFLAAVNDLTATACEKFDAELTAPQSVFCQSVGSRLNKAANGKFPLNLSYRLVKHFDGPNDGLVSEEAFCWGEQYRLLTTDGSRGISHGDVIDLNRENIPGFDVRAFYVELVRELKERGL